ncbi:MAG: trypsin-like peptidase domain-containing protein [Deltaproteobacteria bacterium]|nr:trypsin-like peptidase domain-containing protein [Deltaproteobacteria bacterium]
MRKTTLLLTTGLAVASLGVGLGCSLSAARQAQAQPQAAITPKTEVPREARSLSQAFATTARALRPSVVRLDIELEARKKPSGRKFRRDDVPPDLERFFEHFFGNPFDGFPVPPTPGRGTGSGVVIDSAGNILTNSHVAERAAKVTVTFADGREFSAKLVGADPKTDIAVVRIEKPPAGLVAARLGDSKNLEVGEWVLAIGSPLGLDQSVTAGIVSGKGKVTRNVHMSGERMREYIQTDAKINPGNSGGPLVNLQGEVIGINTLINVGPGGAYGFAIPINQARQVAKAIITEGRVRHAWLGVAIGDVKDGVKLGDDGEPEQKGQAKGAKGLPAKAAWVSRVMPGSPAEKAGVRVGDVITQIDGQKVEGAADVVDYVSARKVGNKVTLAYVRDGKNGKLPVTLGELPETLSVAGEAGAKKDKIGVDLQTLTPEMAGALGLGPSAKGAVITDVEPGSRAAKAGLRPEDLILEIDRKPIASAEDAVAALGGGGKRAHLFKVRRAGMVIFVTVPAP